MEQGAPPDGKANPTSLGSSGGVSVRPGADARALPPPLPLPPHPPLSF